jgi:hypothetical protein
VTRPTALRLAVQIVFVLALIVGVPVALAPGDDSVGLIPWDKAKHFLAFYGYAGLAAAALPRRPLWVPAALVVAYGALIEVLQGLPAFHRDADGWDLFADAFAVFCCYLPLLLPKWRRWVG